MKTKKDNAWVSCWLTLPTRWDRIKGWFRRKLRRPSNIDGVMGFLPLKSDEIHATCMMCGFVVHTYDEMQHHANDKHPVLTTFKYENGSEASYSFPGNILSAYELPGKAPEFEPFFGKFCSAWCGKCGKTVVAMDGKDLCAHVAWFRKESDGGE